MREMKDSGIEWIGVIPANWSITTIGRLFTAKAGGDAKPYYYAEDKDDAHPYPVYTNTLDKNQVYAYTSNPEFPANTITVTGRGDIGHAIYRDNQFDAIIRLNVLIPKYKLDLRYYAFFIDTVVPFFTNSAAIGQLSANQIIPYRVCFLPIEQQKIIADFLENKSTSLEILISDLQSQIETLEEYKRSVITEAVTKGLDPDVEMRDSGIAWVGDIPAHWITHPLYFYFGERKNKNALGLETNLLSLSYGKIIRKDINSNGGLLPESFNTYNIIEKDDIIIRPTDLQNDKRSLRTGIAREHGIITSAYIAMKAIKAVNPEYFHYLLHAYDVMKVFYNMGNGVRQGLNFSEFSRLMVFEPTIEEQNAIVAYLKEKCDEIDLAIAEKKQQIETIEEYKKSLIFEYVTGKKEVDE